MTMDLMQRGSKALASWHRKFNVSEEHADAELKTWANQSAEVYRKVEAAVRREMVSRVNAQITSMILSPSTDAVTIESNFRDVLIHIIIRDVLAKEVTA
tara:strand:- start:224 stop:520 length:297 start_codon:yes stop_codon:yes gene_type:complete